MAALLRQGAARRLGGSMVQRAEAAVPEGRRRLGPRLMHTDELHSNNRHVQQVEEQLARELRGHVEVRLEVQLKKEQLYDLVAKADQSFGTSSFRDRRLRQFLAVQVIPRPEDSEWRRLRFARRANSLLEAAGLLALTGVVSSGLLRYKSHRGDMKAIEMEKEREVNDLVENN